MLEGKDLKAKQAIIRNLYMNEMLTGLIPLTNVFRLEKYLQNVNMLEEAHNVN